MKPSILLDDIEQKVVFTTGNGWKYSVSYDHPKAIGMIKRQFVVPHKIDRSALHRREYEAYLAQSQAAYQGSRAYMDGFIGAYPSSALSNIFKTSLDPINWW